MGPVWQKKEEKYDRIRSDLSAFDSMQIAGFHKVVCSITATKFLGFSMITEMWSSKYKWDL